MYKTALDIASAYTDQFVRSACFRAGFLDNGVVRPDHGPQTVAAIQGKDGASEYPYEFASLEEALAGIEVLREFFGYSKSALGAVVIHTVTSQGPLEVYLSNRTHFRAARLWGVAADA